MSGFAHRWKAFWDNKVVPMHTKDDDEHYVPLSQELVILFHETRSRSVLEIGCGNGALYKHLGFDRVETYKGVDFSQSMLDRFRQTFPQVSLVAANGHTYQDDNKYDLIFSHGLVQYFDRPMLDEHLKHAANMLAPQGTIVCASVPWKCFRARYLQGKFARRPRSITKMLLGYLRYPFLDAMGHWFEWADFETFGRRHGLSVRFFGSLHYPYRFHAVLRRDSQNQVLPKAA
jgi:SAM-dependent methyltransferase